MKKTILGLVTLALVTGCKDVKKDEARRPKTDKTVVIKNENPLLLKSKLDYGAPNFDLIKNKHFLPAILEGMKIQNAEIKKIIDSKDAPTFKNTILELEESSKVMDNVTNVFYGLAGAHSNDTIKKYESELAPKFSEHKDNILLNELLFTKVKQVYSNLDSLDLDAESKHLVRETYNRFVKAGANLSEENKKALKDVNSQLAVLSKKFNDKVLAASKEGGLKIDKTKLKGLSTDKINTYAKGTSCYIQLTNTTQQPDLASLEDREVRKQLFTKSFMRTDGGKFDTNEIVAKTTLLRAKKAKILGFDTYAEWSLQGTMAGRPKKVFEMFAGLVPGGIHKAKNEIKEIQAEINKTDTFKLEPCDWNFYAEKVRKSKYNLDQNEIKPYFELHKVLEDGVFFAATKLYGITFKKRTDIPTYHPDVLVYELFEEDGTKLGLFYGDYYARDSKRGGAWMSTFVKQSKLRKQKPVVYNVCNFQKPQKGQPALITFDDAETIFHEFGHALHGFFGNQKYASLSGTSVSRDYVEFPSQFNENWMTHPTVLNNYAKHYETGELIPQALLDKVKAAGTFNQGYSIIENLAASSLDMKFHTMKLGSELSDVAKFENDALDQMKLNINEIPPRYRLSYFSHIFSGGYAAGYYSYLWTELISHDAYRWFELNGSLTRENGQKFRDMILSKGNTMDYAEMYRNFTGANPKPEPMLKARGLIK